MRDPLTYRHPRTLDEAFGPDAHSAHPFEGPDPTHCRADRPVIVTCFLGALFLALGAYQGWL